MNKEFKISGFKTPEKYFDTIEARLFSRMDEEKLPKENGFLVPEGYFENLENRLLNSEKPLKKPNKTIPLFSKKSYAYVAAIAASIILGILIFNPNQSNSTLDSIQLSMIDTYIEEGNLNIDLYELISYFELDEIPLENFEPESIPQKTLENYLLENSDDYILMNIPLETEKNQN